MLYSFHRYRHYFGVVVTHQAAALFSARRDEMIVVMTQTLFYLDARRPVVVHLPFSNLPREVISYFKHVNCGNELSMIFGIMPRLT